MLFNSLYISHLIQSLLHTKLLAITTKISSFRNIFLFCPYSHSYLKCPFWVTPISICIELCWECPHCDIVVFTRIFSHMTLNSLRATETLVPGKWKTIIICWMLTNKNKNFKGWKVFELFYNYLVIYFNWCIKTQKFMSINGVLCDVLMHIYLM